MIFVTDMLDDFVNFLHEERKSENTIIAYHQHIKRFFEYLNSKSKDRGFMSESDPHEFLISRYKSMSAATYNAALMSLRAFLKFVGLSCDLVRSPKKIQRDLGKYKMPDTAQVKLMMSKAEKMDDGFIGVRNRAMLATLYYTGIRPDELHRVKIEDIDFGKKTLNIPFSKNGQSRVIPISESFFDEIVKYYAALMRLENNESPYLFVSHGRNHRFKKISYGATRHIIKRILSESGYPNMTPYSLRHLFATNLWRGGANESDISNLMGHKNLRSLFDYVVPKKQSNREAVELL